MSAPTPNDAAPITAVGSYITTPATDDSHGPTTKFADDTIGVDAHSGPREYATVNRYAQSRKAPATDRLVDYLSRPSVITSGSFTSSDSGVLYYTSVASVMNSLKSARLSNQQAIKFDLKFTLQVNADRFQCGRYILGILPMAGGAPGGGNPNAAWYAMHMANLTTITQLPHVEIDLSKQTHATINYPFTYIAPALEFSAASPAFGCEYARVFIMPYSALVPGTGGSTADYTLWGSFENVELFSTTINQMGDISTKEAKAQNIGPISGPLAKFSVATGILGEIPLLGPYAQSVSWISDIMSRSAKAMGWSKPLNQEAPSRMIRQVLPFSAVSDVSDNGRPLGVMSTNSVVADPQIGNPKFDEMSIDFIKSRWAYYATLNWPVSSTSGTNLLSYDMDPSDFSTTWSKGFAMTPVCFLASYFGYWRGGLKFRFKIVKTEFHRGRLLIAFSPSSINKTSSTFTYGNTELVFREIVDISTTSEFEICVPYMIPRAWLASGQSMGRLMMFVENALTAPTSVANQVSIIVEVCGDDDFRVSCPIEYCPVDVYAPSTNQMADPYVATPCFKLGVSAPDVGVEAYTIGEEFTSLRQWIKRLDHLAVAAGNPLGTSAITHTVRGYSHWCDTQAATTAGAINRPEMISNWFNVFAFFYQFNTGSVRIKMMSDVDTKQIAWVNSRPSNFYNYTTSAGSNYQRTKTITPSTIEGVIDYQLPVWQPMLARSVIDHMEGSNLSSNINDQRGNVTSLNFSQPYQSGNVNYLMFRSAGDDYNMFNWVGIPALILSTTA